MPNACAETHEAVAVVSSDGAIDPAMLEWLAAAIWFTAASILAEALGVFEKDEEAGVLQVAIRLSFLLLQAMIVF